MVTGIQCNIGHSWSAFETHSVPTYEHWNQCRRFCITVCKKCDMRFGLPSSIISDHDPCWTSDFWRSVVKHLKTRMALSSSHHPQHDGQTEIVNKMLESMLRAYTSEDRNSWAEWLHLLEFTYNSHVHASTGTTPVSATTRIPNLHLL